jgi:hypothetical protein
VKSLEKISLKWLKNEYPEFGEYLKHKRQVVAYRRGDNAVEVVSDCDEIHMAFRHHEFFERKADKWTLSMVDYYSAEVRFDNQSVTVTAPTITELLYRLSAIIKAMVC